ncbi:MAG: hypothetical protein OEN23_12055 [Paracoccaceae bacterium]|nr:hypothetical protein [Paracoccaceae bacterium]
MPTTRFTQSDVKRAAKGALAAGLTVVRVEVDQDGRVIVITDDKDARASGANDWDRP